MNHDEVTLASDIEKHFYGTATVGERGQIVIPAEARKKHNISTGDKLLIMSSPDEKCLMLLKIDAMREFMTFMNAMLQEVQRGDHDLNEQDEKQMEEPFS